ncbi:MAG: nickel pincer cofactor biosynthesis protein LarC [Acidobacteriales bacterium]|nr:nickel pincer cofactor biosynthesis protein LarC [Terriglobales bacterium]
MRIAYLDCFSGMSGDMFLGALVDAGVPQELMTGTVSALNIGARLEFSRVDRSGIIATKVDVYANGEKDLPREEYWAKREQESRHPEAVEHRHTHEGDHAHEQHAHTHAHSHEHGESHSHGRGLKEIREIILAAAISESAKQTALRIFEALGVAEAKIHDRQLETIHFHEVGSVDAMVDIVAAAVGAEALGVEEFRCSPLNVGSGTVRCAHGTLPVPAPATVELLRGVPVYSGGIAAELVTPTGAAIVKTLVSRYGSFPAMRIEKSAYGAGTRNPEGFPNVVRLTIGETQASSASETVAVIEANVDDMNPQLFGYVTERLLEEGALDVLTIPAQMKKGRPGTLLMVLCAPAERERVAQIILAETTTLGVRWREEQRLTLPREWVEVATRWGKVRVKVAGLNSAASHVAPEYEDCRRIAREHRVPLKLVIQEAMHAYVQQRTP